MKLSKLIQQLEKIQKKNGDVEVMTAVDGYDCQVDSVKFRSGEEDVPSRAIVYLGLTEGIDY